MKTETKFVVCIENKNYPASLEFGKIYRVMDESGEDYLFSEKSFALELNEALLFSE